MRYLKEELQQLSVSLLTACGLSAGRAQTVATTLLESDLMGHTTHGLALLPVYLKELESGGMAREGEPEVLQDNGASFSWDGVYLPGPYLVHKAIDQGIARIKDHPVVTATIQKTHHIGCLAAYPEKVTRQGLVLLLSCSDPRNATVAPFGGLKGTYSPNPIAAGFPTDGDPILIDISMSSTANGYIIQKHKAGEKLPHAWLQDAKGQTTDDPEDFFVDPPATILPLGNQDSGYKGFALGILVEALTSALGGFGRASQPDNWGASVFLQIINPEAFGGLAYFKKEMSFFKENALNNPVPDGAPPVRLPGQRAIALKKEYLASGIELYPSILPGIEPFAEKYGLTMPKPIG